MNKYQLLIELLEKNNNEPTQGSQEWVSDRKKTIGGSEVDLIVNKFDKFTKDFNIIKLLKNKLGLSDFTGNIHTLWGNLLEPFAIKYFESIFDTKVNNTGSIKNVVPGRAYSPDGLVYLSIADLIILLEIKCPTRRNPNGKVPENYLSQIYTGLQVIKIWDYALFLDCAFRRCSLQEFKFNEEHDDILHKKTSYNVEEIKLCLVGFYTENWEEKELDLGTVSIEALESVLSNKKLKVYYSEIINNNTENNLINDYRSHINNNISVGILPLKLMKVELTIVGRYDWRSDNQDDEYLDKYKEIIYNILTLINSLNSLNREDKIEIIEKNKKDYIKIFTLWFLQTKYI